MFVCVTVYYMGNSKSYWELLISTIITTLTLLWVAGCKLWTT